MPAVVNVPGGSFAAGATLLYTAQLVDPNYNPIAGSALNTLVLTIADTMTGAIINNCQDVNILNTGRGTIDESGNLTITLSSADTAMSETPAPQVQRSLIYDWTYNGGQATGRHQANFVLTALAAT